MARPQKQDTTKRPHKMKGVRIPADMGDELEDAHWNLRLSEQAIIIMALDDFLVANGFRKKKKHGQTKR